MIVVKVGGSEGVDLGLVCRDVAELVRAGEQVLLVHGASHETDVISSRLGKPPRIVTSVSGYQSRYTDRETLEIFTMVYAGKVNKLVVEQLQRLGVNAIGLSGADGRLMEGPRKSTIRIVERGKRKVLRGDYTGRVERVNVELIRLLTEAGYTLAICPPAISYENDIINVDGDRAAAALAAALKADTLVILSNVPGLLRDPEDESSLIPRISREELSGYDHFAQGRMRKKLLGAEEALQGGVGRIVLGDARIERPVQQALAGRGTVIE